MAVATAIIHSIRPILANSHFFKQPSFARSAVRYLDKRRPAFVSVHELGQCAMDAAISHCLATAGSHPLGDNAEDLVAPWQEFLWKAISAGAIDIALFPPQVTNQISPRPTVSRLARVQAKQGIRVSNQLRETIFLSNASRFVASLLDGTRDCNQLKHSLRQAIDEGTVIPGFLEQSKNDGELVENALEVLRSAGMLMS